MKAKGFIEKLILFVLPITLCIFFTGCSGASTEDEVTQDSGIGDNEENEEEYMRDSMMKVSDEEKEFLCHLYSDEERIGNGNLLSYQEETLKQYRFAKEYLHDKYPGYRFDFFCFIPASKMNGPVTKVDFMEQNKESEYGTLA